MRRRGRLRIVPLSGDSSSRIIRKSVVLPAPLGPTKPTREPGRRCAVALLQQNPRGILFIDRLNLEHDMFVTARESEAYR